MIGWRCPGCGRCFAPSMAMCAYCAPPLPANSTKQDVWPAQGEAKTLGPLGWSAAVPVKPK